MCVGLFAIALPISTSRSANIKKNSMFFSMQPYDEKLRIAQNYQGAEYKQDHFINWWLIARELIDHGGRDDGANAMEWSKVFPDAWKFMAQYIQVTRFVLGRELNASPMSYLEWPQYMQLQPPACPFDY